jgi:type IV secretory pathway VirB10-like protein
MHNPEIPAALRALRAGTLVLLLGIASAASAQWAWRDEHGTTVYSDEPPPLNVKATDILRRPLPPPPSDSSDAQAQSPSNAAPPQAAVPSPPPAPAVRPPTMAEREQEFRKRQKERADSEKKLAEAQAEAAQKAEDCERARGYMKSLDDGVRLVRTNPDGSREAIDESQREAEAQRAREIIQTRCN